MKRRIVFLAVMAIASAILLSACSNAQNKTPKAEKSLAAENEYYEVYEQ